MKIRIIFLYCMTLLLQTACQKSKNPKINHVAPKTNNIKMVNKGSITRHFWVIEPIEKKDIERSEKRESKGMDK